jgi:ferredoxin
MSTQTSNHFESYLKKFGESEWQTAIQSLLPAIHEVDRTAVQIWFRFYPLALEQYLEAAPDLDEAKRTLAMQGDFGLDNRIDSSHYFLYGHRYWKTVKAAIEAESQVFENQNIDLADEIMQIATMIAEKLKSDKSLLIGITAVGFMTLAQVGLEMFKAAVGEVQKPSGLMKKAPDAIVASRKQDDSQGLLGFLKTVNKKFSVIYDESKDGRFDIMNDQEIASASANDRSQDWQAKDSRCWEGPVPVECTSASCGTCWVGVLGGADKLSKVARRERRAVKVFGYDQTDASQPLIRLACQTKALGNVTIVIPPWNAVFGKKVYGNVEELDLEPVTTSAKALREAVREAAAGESSD